jgi:hypothetical protein
LWHSWSAETDHRRLDTEVAAVATKVEVATVSIAMQHGEVESDFADYDMSAW